MHNVSPQNWSVLIMRQVPWRRCDELGLSAEFGEQVSEGVKAAVLGKCEQYEG